MINPQNFSNTHWDNIKQYQFVYILQSFDELFLKDHLLSKQDVVSKHTKKNEISNIDIFSKKLMHMEYESFLQKK